MDRRGEDESSPDVVGSVRSARRVGVGTAALSISIIAFSTLWPGGQPVPLSAACFACGALGGVDAVLNVVLFVPLGIGLRWMSNRLPVAVAGGLLVTLAIEALQWKVVTGRHASFGDILFNVLGAATGAWAATRVGTWWNATGPHARRLAFKSALIAVALVVIMSLLLQPVGLHGLYGVQWTPIRPHLDIFPGTLQMATVNSLALHPAQVVGRGMTPETDTPPFRVSAAISDSGRATDRMAHILRIANPSNEGLLLAQRGEALVFRAPMLAGRFRLRVVLVEVPRAFAVDPASAGKLVHEATVDARSSAREIALGIERDDRTQQTLLSRTPGMGWTLLSPWDIAISPAWWPLNAAWLAILVLPASFFAVRARSGGRIAEWPLVSVVASLVLVPWWLGAGLLSSAEWFGVLCGLLAGGSLAARQPRTLERTVIWGRQADRARD